MITHPDMKPYIEQSQVLESEQSHIMIEDPEYQEVAHESEENFYEFKCCIRDLFKGTKGKVTMRFASRDHAQIEVHFVQVEI